VKDPEIPLIVLPRLPAAYDLIPVFEEVHLETQRIGGGTSETVVTGQTGIGILERFHIFLLYAKGVSRRSGPVDIKKDRPRMGGLFVLGLMWALAGYDCVGGANVDTGAAVGALFRIDLVDGIALGNGVNRTFGLTRTTSYTFVSNLVCHWNLLSLYNLGGYY